MKETSAAEHEAQVKIKLRSKSNVCYYPHPPTQNPPPPKRTKKKNKIPHGAETVGVQLVFMYFFLGSRILGTRSKSILETTISSFERTGMRRSSRRGSISATVDTTVWRRYRRLPRRFDATFLRPVIHKKIIFWSLSLSLQSYMLFFIDDDHAAQTAENLRNAVIRILMSRSVILIHQDILWFSVKSVNSNFSFQKLPVSWLFDATSLKEYVLDLFFDSPC